MSEGVPFAERAEALASACALLEGLEAELWQCSGPELGPFLSVLDRLGECVAAARVAVLVEAVDRGEAGVGTPASLRDWLVQWAPSLRAGGAVDLVTTAQACRGRRSRTQAGSAPSAAPPDSAYDALGAAVLDARVPVVNAACVIDEWERLRHRLHPEAHEAAMDLLVSLAEAGTRREIRKVRRRIVAQYGREGEFQAQEDRLKERMTMSQPRPDGGGLVDYHLVVDQETTALIESAIQALSAPRPVEGVPDRRPSGQRRIDALVEVVRRGVASAEGVPSTTKAQLMVTMSLDDLRDRTFGGTVLGTTAAGTLIGPEAVRRLACDASVVPVVLGGRGDVLDWGRRVRLFTFTQTQALWLRDGGCTFPDCDVPASWCDAHHLQHWVDGGQTDRGNGALLCGRHHTLVHRHGFHGEVHGDQVVWDVTPGAYDHWLATSTGAMTDSREAGERAPDGPEQPPFGVWGEPRLRGLDDPPTPSWPP